MHLPHSFIILLLGLLSSLLTPTTVGVSVCLLDKTKTAETAVTAAGIVRHESFNVRSKGQQSKSQGHKVQNILKVMKWPA